MSPSSIAKHWCFTLNNYDEEDLVHFRQLVDEKKVSYCCFQQEKGASETPHLQGYFSLYSKKRLSTLKKLVSDKAHFEVARGSPLQNLLYCSKEDTRIPDTKAESFGTISEAPRARNDLNAFKSAVKEGIFDKKRLLEDHSEVCAKYPRFVDSYLRANEAPLTVSDHPLRIWQKELEATLATDPDDRTIIFIVDKEGNKGKTWFCKKYCTTHADAQYMEPAKKADMAYALRTDARVLMVNVTRQQVEHLQYSFYESVKDQLVFSPKYDSHTKTLPLMHVVIMMNQDPDMTKLSDDRYDIRDITDS